MKHRFTAPMVAVLVLALAAFTGSALAGDGHGNGSGGGNGSADKQSSTSAGDPATGGSNSQGVKPSNTTKHYTYAKASSDQTKKYGNGQTAGQIATKSGHGDATLHGPGNSQPHKTVACPGGHEVDVHALKNKDDKCATSEHLSQKSNHVESKKVEVKKSEKTHVEKSQKSEKSDVESKKHDDLKVEVKKTESHGVAASTHAHVTICHATGSSSNPYVRISPSASGVFHGHLGHQDGRDIVPPFTWQGQTYSANWDANGQAMYNAGCTAPAQAQVQGVQSVQSVLTNQDCGTTTQTVTEQVLVGVKHMIGQKGSGRFVFIHPNEHSAHFTGKHEDDVPVYETVTKTITVPVTNCPAAPVQQSAPSATVTTTSAPAPATVTAQAAGVVVPAAAPASVAIASASAPAPAAATPAVAVPAVGGVKGAVVALKPTKTKPAGGVLGTTTRLGGSIASTRLPFTGLPLWAFALVAAGLIVIGLTVRRSANRI
jgi:hypothetical protein